MSHESHSVAPEDKCKIPMKSGIAEKMEEIPPTPTNFTDELVNPFERSQTSLKDPPRNNAGAHAVNGVVEALPSSSEDLDVGADPFDPLSSTDVSWDGWLKHASNPTMLGVDAH